MATEVYYFVLVSGLYSVLFWEGFRESGVAGSLLCSQMLHWRPLITAFCSDTRFIEILHLLFLGFSHASQPRVPHLLKETWCLGSLPLVVPAALAREEENGLSVATAQVLAAWTCSLRGPPPWALQLIASQQWQVKKPSSCFGFQRCNFLWKVPFCWLVLYLPFHLSVMLSSTLLPAFI